MRKKLNIAWISRGPVFAVVPLLLGCMTVGAVERRTGPSPAGVGEDKPSLVVYLVVDQLRGDLLDRYASVFTGGFKRLMEEGLNFRNALHAHAQTETSPGHATLSTGVFPARAGIPSNAWREGEGGNLHPVYNVVDPEESLVGIVGLPGSSPSVLRRTGLADWIMDADPDAKVVSVSAKDRAAVLMAGKSRGEVYWFNSRVGRFVTSTYYRSNNPDWLNRFNGREMKEYQADTVWTSTIPADAVDLSAPDTAAFEGDGIHTFFPHRFSEEVTEPGEGDFNFWFETTPMLDRATLDVALLAMSNEKMGRLEGRTDFLSISFSQTDRVGHTYGPLSREQMDNLLRLDRILDELFSVLDRDIGRENYVVALTGDHGVMNNPERIDEGGLRLDEGDRATLEQALAAAAREAGSDPSLSVSEAMVRALADVAFVGPAYSHETLLNGGEAGDSILQLFEHSMTPGRPGGLLSTYGVEMWWAENTLPWALPVGTTHGSPFFYDRWVPLFLIGPGVEAGTVDDLVRPMDLAPTLAQIAEVPFPEDLDGKPLTAYLRQESLIR